MDHLVDCLSTLTAWMWRASWQASVVVLVVLVVQWTIGRRLAPRWRYGLWLIVVARLVMPVCPPSTISIFNLLPFASREDSRTVAVEPLAVEENLLPTPMPVVADPAEAPPLRAAVRQAIAAEITPLGEVAPGGEPPSGTGPTSQRLAPDVPAQHVTDDAPWNWAATLAVLWLVGTVAALIRLLSAHVRLAAAVRGATRADDVHLRALLETCKKQMRVRGDLPLLISPEVPSPALAGLLRPKLLLPPAALQDLDDRQMRFVFLHELAHHRCRDIAGNWRLAVLGAMQWFNPVIGYALRRCKADRELARDAMVVAAAGHQQRQAYGQTLLRLAQRCNGAYAELGAIGLFERPPHLAERIAAILGRRRPWAGHAVVAMAIMLGVAGVTLSGPVGHVAMADLAAPVISSPVMRVFAQGERQHANRLFWMLPGPVARTDRLTQPLGSRSRVTAETHNGSISFTASPHRTTVHVDAAIAVSGAVGVRASEILNQTHVVAEVSPTTIAIRVQKPPTAGSESIQVALTIALPACCHLQLTTHNGCILGKGPTATVEARTHNGLVNVWDASGDLFLRTHNGQVRCGNIVGDVDAATHNGAIDIAYAPSAPPACHVQASTHNGWISLRPPPTLSARVRAETDGGRISTHLPLAVTGQTGQRAEGVIGEGKGVVLLRTHNGSIDIHP